LRAHASINVHQTAFAGKQKMLWVVTAAVLSAEFAAAFVFLVMHLLFQQTHSHLSYSFVFWSNDAADRNSDFFST
jgi:hypothetical protein